jgi:hypothetical protein
MPAVRREAGTLAMLPSLAELRLHGRRARPRCSAIGTDCEGRAIMQRDATCYFMTAIAIVQVLLKGREHKSDRLGPMLKLDDDGKVIAVCLRNPADFQTLLPPELVQLYDQFCKAEYQTYTFNADSQPGDAANHFFCFLRLFVGVLEDDLVSYENLFERGAGLGGSSSHGADASAINQQITQRATPEYAQSVAEYMSALGDDRKQLQEFPVGLTSGGHPLVLTLSMLMFSGVDFVYYYDRMPLHCESDEATRFNDKEKLLLLQHCNGGKVQLRYTSEDYDWIFNILELLQYVKHNRRGRSCRPLGAPAVEDETNWKNKRLLGIVASFTWDEPSEPSESSTTTTRESGVEVGHSIAIFPCDKLTNWQICDSNSKECYYSFDTWAREQNIPAYAKSCQFLLCWERGSPHEDVCRAKRAK